MNIVDKLQRRLLKGRLITTLMIRREYAITHEKTGDDLQALVASCTLTNEDFPVSDLKLSLNDFSRKQGWMR